MPVLPVHQQPLAQPADDDAPLALPAADEQPRRRHLPHRRPVTRPMQVADPLQAPEAQHPVNRRRREAAVKNHPKFPHRDQLIFPPS